MSVKLMAEVWTRRFNSGQRDVLLVMADHANDNGVCWPSLPLIAWKTDKDRRSVRRIMRGLEEVGIVECIANQTGGRGRARVYRLHLDKADKKSPFVSDAEEREEFASLTSGNTAVEVPAESKEDVVSPFPKRRTSERERGTLAREKEDTAMSSEPSRTTNEPPSSPTVDETSTRDTGRETYEILQLTFRPGRKYPARFKGHLERQVKEILDEGFGYNVVLEAAKRVERRGLNPGTLASVVNEIENGSAFAPRNGHKPFDAESHDYSTTVIG